MLVRCPRCGKMINVNGLGRKPLDIPVINICGALQLHRNVTEAAKELGCSRGYVYKVLNASGLKVKDVAEGKVTIK